MLVKSPLLTVVARSAAWSAAGVLAGIRVSAA
jgi:hypothetical protein